MERRKRRFLTAMRLDHQQKAMVDVVAEIEGVSVDELLRSIVIPAIAERLSERVTEIGGVAGRDLAGV